MNIVNLVEGRYLNPYVVCCVISLDTVNYQHYINKWKEQGQVINICQEQKPRSAVIFLGNLVLITSVSAETIRDRLSAAGEIQSEMDIFHTTDICGKYPPPIDIGYENT